MEKKVKKSFEYRVRTIARKNYLLGNGQCYEISDEAKSIWKLLNGKNTIKNIEDKIRSEYLVEDEVDLIYEIENCIQELIELGTVLEC